MSGRRLPHHCNNIHKAKLLLRSSNRAEGDDIFAGSNMQIVKSSETSKEKSSEKRDVGYKKGANLDMLAPFSHALFMAPVFH